MSALVALIGSAGALGVAAVLDSDQRQAADSQMTRRAELVTEAVTTETRRYVDTLQTVAAGAGAVETLDAAKFAQLTGPLRTMRISGATSLALAVPATTGQIPQVQELWRTRGAPTLELKPVGTGEDHIFTIYSEPLDGGPPAVVGTDVSQLAEPLQAFTRARDSKAVAISNTYLLLRDRNLPEGQRQLSFIITAPVFGSAGDFRGWVLMGLRGKDFVGSTIKRVSENLSVDVMLHDHDAAGKPVSVAGLAALVPGERDMHRHVEFSVAQNTWGLEVSAPSSEIPGATSALPATVAGGGTIASLLLAGLVYVLATGRSRAQHRVEQATGQLREAEAEARSQATLTEAVLNSISDGVAVVDANGEYILHNPAAKRILGVDLNVNRPDAWQAHYGIYLPDGSAPFPVEKQPLIRALEGEPTDGVEMLIRNAGQPNGVRISVSGRPLGSEAEQPGAVAVFRDVTAQKAQEADLTAFAGLVAHEIRTPLTVVAGYAELLSETVDAGITDPQALREPLTNITAGAQRMTRLIHDLFEYVTTQDAALNITNVDLRALAAEVAGGVSVAPGQPEPEIHIGELPVVRGDFGMLRQLLGNLLGNAVKYTAPGEAAHVTLTVRPDRPGWTWIEVADRGLGIPDGQYEAIFDEFHRAHTEGPYGGTGLGLAICRRIVQRHGGMIMAAENEGGGSRFSFTLQLSHRDKGRHRARQK